MSTHVERWLGTFMCQKYAPTFEACGFKSLQSVCQISVENLQSMGILPNDVEKIMENVTIMRQSFPGLSRYPEPQAPASSMLMSMSRGMQQRGVDMDPAPPDPTLGHYMEGNPGGMYGFPQGPTAPAGMMPSSHGMQRYPVPTQPPGAGGYPYPAQNPAAWSGSMGPRYPQMGPRFDRQIMSGQGPRFEPHLMSSGPRFDPGMMGSSGPAGPAFDPRMMTGGPRFDPHMAAAYRGGAAGPRFDPHGMPNMSSPYRTSFDSPQAQMPMGRPERVQGPQQIADSIVEMASSQQQPPSTYNPTAGYSGHPNQQLKYPSRFGMPPSSQSGGVPGTGDPSFDPFGSHHPNGPRMPGPPHFPDPSVSMTRAAPGPEMPSSSMEGTAFSRQRAPFSNYHPAPTSGNDGRNTVFNPMGYPEQMANTHSVYPGAISDASRMAPRTVMSHPSVTTSVTSPVAQGQMMRSPQGQMIMSPEAQIIRSPLPSSNAVKSAPQTPQSSGMVQSPLNQGQSSVLSPASSRQGRIPTPQFHQQSVNSPSFDHQGQLKSPLNTGTPSRPLCNIASRESIASPGSIHSIPSVHSNQPEGVNNTPSSQFAVDSTSGPQRDVFSPSSLTGATMSPGPNASQSSCMMTSQIKRPEMPSAAKIPENNQDVLGSPPGRMQGFGPSSNVQQGSNSPYLNRNNFGPSSSNSFLNVQSKPPQQSCSVPFSQSQMMHAAMQHQGNILPPNIPGPQYPSQNMPCADVSNEVVAKPKRAYNKKKKAEFIPSGPLESLHKLAMLSDNQVVDPKSVVRDAYFEPEDVGSRPRMETGTTPQRPSLETIPTPVDIPGLPPINPQYRPPCYDSNISSLPAEDSLPFVTDQNDFEGIATGLPDDKDFQSSIDMNEFSSLVHGGEEFDAIEGPSPAKKKKEDAINTTNDYNKAEFDSKMSPCQNQSTSTGIKERQTKIREKDTLAFLLGQEGGKKDAMNSSNSDKNCPHSDAVEPNLTAKSNLVPALSQTSSTFSDLNKDMSAQNFDPPEIHIQPIPSVKSDVSDSSKSASSTTGNLKNRRRIRNFITPKITPGQPQALSGTNMLPANNPQGASPLCGAMNTTGTTPLTTKLKPGPKKGSKRGPSKTKTKTPKATAKGKKGANKSRNSSPVDNRAWENHIQSDYFLPQEENPYGNNLHTSSYLSPNQSYLGSDMFQYNSGVSSRTSTPNTQDSSSAEPQYANLTTVDPKKIHTLKGLLDCDMGMSSAASSTVTTVAASKQQDSFQIDSGASQLNVSRNSEAPYLKESSRSVEGNRVKVKATTCNTISPKSHEIENSLVAVSKTHDNLGNSGVEHTESKNESKISSGKPPSSVLPTYGSETLDHQQRVLSKNCQVHHENRSLEPSRDVNKVDQSSILSKQTVCKSISQNHCKEVDVTSESIAKNDCEQNSHDSAKKDHKTVLEPSVISDSDKNANEGNPVSNKTHTSNSVEICSIPVFSRSNSDGSIPTDDSSSESDNQSIDMSERRIKLNKSDSKNEQNQQVENTLKSNVTNDICRSGDAAKVFETDQQRATPPVLNKESYESTETPIVNAILPAPALERNFEIRNSPQNIDNVKEIKQHENDCVKIEDQNPPDILNGYLENESGHCVSNTPLKSFSKRCSKHKDCSQNDCDNNACKNFRSRKSKHQFLPLQSNFGAIDFKSDTFKSLSSKNKERLAQPEDNLSPDHSHHSDKNKLYKSPSPRAQNVFDMLKEFSSGNTNMNNSSDDSESSLGMTDFADWFESDSEESSKSEREKSSRDSFTDVRKSFSFAFSRNKLRFNSRRRNSKMKAMEKVETSISQTSETRDELKTKSGDLAETTTEDDPKIKQAIVDVAERINVLKMSERKLNDENSDVDSDSEPLNSSGHSNHLRPYTYSPSASSASSQCAKFKHILSNQTSKPEKDAARKPPEPASVPKMSPLPTICGVNLSPLVGSLEQVSSQKYSRARKRKMGKSLTDVIQRITAQKEILETYPDFFPKNDVSNSSSAVSKTQDSTMPQISNNTQDFNGNPVQSSPMKSSVANDTKQCSQPNYHDKKQSDLKSDFVPSETKFSPPRNMQPMKTEIKNEPKNIHSKNCVFPKREPKCDGYGNEHRTKQWLERTSDILNTIKKELEDSKTPASHKDDVNDLNSVRRSSRRSTRVNLSARFLESNSEDEWESHEWLLSKRQSLSQTIRSITFNKNEVIDNDLATNNKNGRANKNNHNKRLDRDFDDISCSSDENGNYEEPYMRRSRSFDTDDLYGWVRSSFVTDKERSDVSFEEEDIIEKSQRYLHNPLLSPRRRGIRKRHPIFLLTKLKKSLLRQEIEKLANFEMNKINNKFALLSTPTENNNILVGDIPVCYDGGKSVLGVRHLKELCESWNVSRQEYVAMPVYREIVHDTSMETSDIRVNENSALENNASHINTEKTNQDIELSADSHGVCNGNQRRCHLISNSAAQIVQRQTSNCSSSTKELDDNPEMPTNPDSSLSEAEVIESDHSYVRVSTPQRSLESATDVESSPNTKTNCKVVITKCKSSPSDKSDVRKDFPCSMKKNLSTVETTETKNSVESFEKDGQNKLSVSNKELSKSATSSPISKGQENAVRPTSNIRKNPLYKERNKSNISDSKLNSGVESRNKNESPVRNVAFNSERKMEHTSEIGVETERKNKLSKKTDNIKTPENEKDSTLKSKTRSPSEFIACSNLAGEVIFIQDAPEEDFTITVNESSQSSTDIIALTDSSVQIVSHIKTEPVGMFKNKAAFSEVNLSPGNKIKSVQKDEATSTVTKIKEENETPKSATKSTCSKRFSGTRRKRKLARYDSDSLSDDETKDSALNMFHLTRTLDIVKNEKRAKKAKLVEKQSHLKGKSRRRSKKAIKKEMVSIPKIPKGPIVKMEGTWSSPTRCKVKNFADAAIDKSKIVIEGLAPPVSYSFDDKIPFVCAFCGHPSNFGGLGDLFGPYYLNGKIRTGSSLAAKSIKLSPVSEFEKKRRKETASPAVKSSPDRPQRNKKTTMDTAEWELSPPKKGSRSKNDISVTNCTPASKNQIIKQDSKSADSDKQSIGKSRKTNESTNTRNSTPKASTSKAKGTPKSSNRKPRSPQSSAKTVASAKIKAAKQTANKSTKSPTSQGTPAAVRSQKNDGSSNENKSAKKLSNRRKDAKTPNASSRGKRKKSDAEGSSVTTSKAEKGPVKIQEGSASWALITNEHSPPRLSHSLVHCKEIPEEVWIHEDCIVWTSSLYISGVRLCGIEEALNVAAQTICSVCKLYGATIGCFSKACGRKYHFLCAERDNCFFEKTNFTVYCVKHKAKKVKSLSCLPT